MSVQQTILARRSIRAYAAEQITQEQLKALVDAALASPSAMNLQPWHFSVCQDAKLLQTIHDETHAFAEKNLDPLPPRMTDPAYQVFYHAPTVIFISAQAQDGPHYASLDCGIAAENIALSAAGMGLGTVILGMPRMAFQGEKGDELRKALQFPEGYDYVISVAVGVPATIKEAHPIGENKLSYIR